MHAQSGYSSKANGRFALFLNGRTWNKTQTEFGSNGLELGQNCHCHVTAQCQVSLSESHSIKVLLAVAPILVLACKYHY